MRQQTNKCELWEELEMRVDIKKVDKSQLELVTIKQDVTMRTCYDNMGVPMKIVPESVTYTIETDGEWGFDWYGVKGEFYKFNRE